MREILFEIEDDVVIKYTLEPTIGENVYKSEVVMDKETFQECYNRWIAPQESEDEECSSECTQSK